MLPRTDVYFKCSRHDLQLQELEWQGMGQMTGICASLKESGKDGKHKQNIKRDMLRKLEARKPNSHAPWRLSKTCGCDTRQLKTD